MSRELVVEEAEAAQPAPEPPAIDIRGLSRRFGSNQALDRASLSVREGQVHALLGPNGAGKTTLLRILAGLVDPDVGEISVLGVPSRDLSPRTFRKLVCMLPSADRTFYLRLSGLENLVFFGRLQGMRRQQAVRKAWECLEAVDLAGAGRKPVNTYSHGMQKRLLVARALLTDPVVLAVDEATHDLDPESARTIQALFTKAAGEGSAVIWATQRLDEIRGFADGVTLLHRGRVRFTGSVPELMAKALTRRFLVHLRTGMPSADGVLPAARSALGEWGTVTPTGESDGEHYVMALRDEVILGDAISRLTRDGIQVLACREERSEIEQAFLFLTGSGDAPDGTVPTEGANE
ncbi:MAG: ABC transporter ATP-binding protein [Actinomycetota bacterium]